MKTFIKITGLTHIYNQGQPGERRALSGVDLTIKKGEYLAVVGPNGSGKSTLARHFNALLLPASGQVLVDNLDTCDKEATWEIRRRVGMVFQNPDNQIVSSLVEEDIAFGAENLGLPQAEVRDRVTAALEQTGLTRFRQHAPYLLSGGQKQRLAIAGVLVMHPDYLVLDEPTAMLDPAGRKELLATLEALNKTGITIVLVTHFMEEAVRAGRILVLADGKSVLTGTPGQVFDQAEILEGLGLVLPAPAQIARGLQRRGFFMLGPIIDQAALVKATLSLVNGGSAGQSTDPTQAALTPCAGSEPAAQVADGPAGIWPCADGPDPVAGQVEPATPPAREHVIKVENLYHTYAPGTPFQVASLKDISLEVFKGEFLAVVGATGSGKTTLIQHFNGLLKPTAGKLTVGGLNAADKEAGRQLWRKVGLVFQRPEQQFFEETVFAEVAFGPNNMGLSEVEVKERVAEALSLVGLEPEQIGPLSPYRLSGGMQRRAAIAGILAMRPQVLILDEPSSGLDPAGRRLLFSALHKVRHTWGSTIILVTHNMDEVGLLAERVAVLDCGRLAMLGTVRDIFRRTEELRALGLDIPIPAAVMERLAAAGQPVRTDVLSNAEAEAEIARLLQP